MNKFLLVGVLSLISAYALAVTTNNSVIPIQDAAAHWVSRDTLLFIKQPDATRFDLQETLADKSRKPIPLATKSTPEVAQFPQLKDFSAGAINLPADTLKSLLKGDLVLNQYNKQGALLASSKIQTAGIIDELYTAGAQDADEITDFGASVLADAVQFKVWAPTARTVNVLLFDANKKPLVPAKLIMQEDRATGAWVAKGGKDLAFAYYQYEVTVFHPASKKIEILTVSDPYSLSLSADGFYSQVIDLNDVKTQPATWAAQASPRVAAPEDNILYEVHIHDFSASDRSIKNQNARGKYAAFLEKDSDGVKHLTELRAAGLNVIHLMPTFDFGTVDFDSEKTISLDDSLEKVCRLNPKNPACTNEMNAKQTLRDLLKSLNSRAGDAQAIIESLRTQDNYNWGYDPFHYTVPQASYAVNSEGSARIVEFREMVAQLHNMGFKVIMDVVYNHTYAAGLHEKSVLDKIVPNYYHRLNSTTGAIEQSTCCDNTATEHVMMAKLMTDSLVVWARDYRINGFRFDLMGHQPKDAMLKAREAVRKIDPDTYFYGEGWNFGEVANNKQFVQATQTEMSGTEIGTFTDRLRDAVRGGSSMDSGKWLRMNQGIGNGLFVVPNDMQPADNNKAKYLNYIDQIHVGLAGNLAAFPLKNTSGKDVVGSGVDYNGSPAGYAKDPADTINYVSKHDNQTLWDNNQYRIAYSVSSTNRVRMQMLSLSYPLLAQGIPFLHMGCEFLRSKSFLRDSYDYGDWFNAVDFSQQTNNYDVGLPPAVKDKDNWPFIAGVLQKSEGRDHVEPQQISLSNAMFLDFIKIRSSSPLFRLRSADEIIKRVSFPNAGANHQAGLMVMKIDNSDLAIDPAIKQIVVVFNNGASQQTFAYEGAKQFKLHPVQVKGADAVVKTSKASTKGFIVPAFTVAVFVR
jgi:pullulanase-type alpha-1,6-glucosidase